MRSTAALAIWVTVALGGVVVGGAITAHHPEFLLDAAPFAGRWHAVVRPQLAIAVAVGAGVALVGPALAATLRWRALLFVTAMASFTWAIAVATTVGWHGVTAPMYEHGGYLEGLRAIGSPGHFLRTFTATWMRYPTHIKGHPPGFVLLLWLLDHVGLAGATWSALLVVAVGASASAAVLLVARDVAGEPVARAAAPFVVLAPAAVWLATSADALFAGVVAWAVVATVAATRSRPWAIAAGLLWAGTLLLSYGLVLAAPIAVAVLVHRRRVDIAIIVGATAVAVLVAFGLGTGFWWPAGLAATRRAYWAGVASQRSAWVFVWWNVSALAFALGPAIAPAFARLRRNGVTLLVGSAVGALVVADLTLLSKAEVERIWLPWVPWALLATACLPRAGRRTWLAAQAATGIGLQVALRSPW